MIIQECKEPLELKLLKYLDSRMTLSSTDHKQLYALKKGYEGELMFEKVWLKQLQGECLIINDLLLEYNGTVFQIDSLLIIPKKIYLFDVKNFEGDYYIDNNIWRKKIDGKEIKDPLLQLNRCESLFRRLLQELKYNFVIESCLIFINPQFMLYSAPLDIPAIFPAQLNYFIRNLPIGPTKLNMTHHRLAEELLSLQLDDSKYMRLPDYQYNQLMKGIPCHVCNGFMSASSVRNQLICYQCGRVESIDSAVMRSVEELKLLFHDRKITTRGIYEWCGEVISKKSIWRILSDNFQVINQGKHSYFIHPKDELEKKL